MATTYHFEYGITTQYNNRTPERDAGSGGGEQSLPPEEHHRAPGRQDLPLPAGREEQPGQDEERGRDLHRAGEPEGLGGPGDQRDRRLGRSERPHQPARLRHHLPLRIRDLAQLRHQRPRTWISARSWARSRSRRTIAGLPPGVVYHFRVVAKTSGARPRARTRPSTSSRPNARTRTSASRPTPTTFPTAAPTSSSRRASAGNVTLFPGDIAVGAGGGFTFSPAYCDDRAERRRAPRRAPSRFGFIGGEGAIPGLNPPNGFMDRYVATRTTSGWVTTYPGRPGRQDSDRRPAAVQPGDGHVHRLSDCRRCSAAAGSPSKAPYVWDINGKSLGRWPTNFNLVPNGDQAVVRRQALGRLLPLRLHLGRAPRSRPVASKRHRGRSTTTTSPRRASSIASVAAGRRTDPAGGRAGRRPEPEDRDRGRLHERLAHPDGGGDEPVLRRKLLQLRARRSSPTRRISTCGSTMPITYEVSPSADAIYAGHDRGRVEGLLHLRRTRSRPRTPTAASTSTSGDEATDSLEAALAGQRQRRRRRLRRLLGQRAATSSWSPPSARTSTTSIASQSGDIYFYSPEQLDPANPGVQERAQSLRLPQRRGPLRDHPRPRHPGRPDADLARRRATWRSSRRTQATGLRRTSRPTTTGDTHPMGGDVRLRPGHGRSPLRLVHPLGRSRRRIVASLDTGVTGERAQLRRQGEPERPVHVRRRPGRLHDRRRARPGGHQPEDRRLRVRRQPRPADHAPGRATATPRAAPSSTRPCTPGFEAISQDGVDLYFSTFETLVPEDHNGSFVKFYDARSGGGFPVTAGLLPCTAADECHGDASAPPPRSRHRDRRRPGLEGGNLSPDRASSPAQAPQKRHHKRHTSTDHAPRGGPQPWLIDRREARRRTAWRSSRWSRSSPSPRSAPGWRPGRGRGPDDHRLLGGGLLEPGRRAPRFRHAGDPRHRATRSPTRSGLRLRGPGRDHDPVPARGDRRPARAAGLHPAAAERSTNCPVAAQVGVASAIAGQEPLYNMEPHPDEAGPGRVRRAADQRAGVHRPERPDRQRLRPHRDHGGIFHLLPLGGLPAPPLGRPGRPETRRQPLAAAPGRLRRTASRSTRNRATRRTPFDAPVRPYFENPTACGGPAQRSASTSSSTTGPLPTRRRPGRRRPAATSSASTRA